MSSKVAMTVLDNAPWLKELKWDAQKLVELLEDPQVGVSTWWGFLGDRIENIAKHRKGASNV